MHITSFSQGEITETEVTEAQKSFFGKVKDRLTTTTATPDKEEAPAKQSPPPPPKKETKEAAVPPPAPPATPVVTAQVAKATKTSDKVLKATEVAKDEVKKKGVQETKEKMSSKSSAVTDSAPEPVVDEEEVVKEVEEVKVEEKGTKRKLVKGVTLIVAAGAVAVARNVVTAWLGRGML
jgi:type IV secretory pathway VirB10-like protein